MTLIPKTARLRAALVATQDMALTLRVRRTKTARRGTGDAEAMPRRHSPYLRAVKQYGPGELVPNVAWDALAIVVLVCCRMRGMHLSVEEGFCVYWFIFSRGR